MDVNNSLHGKVKAGVFIIIGLLSLTPFVSAPFALLFGIVLAFIGWVPEQFNLGALVKKLLAVSIVGMGFGIHFTEAIQSSYTYLSLILLSIILTLGAAVIFSRALRVHQETGLLIGAGTAICGGSAIAATAAAIQANSERIAVALGCVFILNSVALWVFPWVGHYFNLSQTQFGVWAAIAIHDTSSVVAAGSVYGDEALQLATTLKLTRALAIIPMAFGISFWFQRQQLKRIQASGETTASKNKVKTPLFIVFYVAAMLFAYVVPQGEPFYTVIFNFSKQALVLCLFLIGAGLSLKTIKTVGIQPFLLALLLWVLISVFSLVYILSSI